MFIAAKQLLRRPQFGITVVRLLTQNEASAALRPFYFAVHPDLFTLHPKERRPELLSQLINEESLKILNNHVESLLNDQRPLQVKRLPFYIREQQQRQQEQQQQQQQQQRPSKKHSPIRLVKIPLDTDNIRSTVSRILEACDLSTDYVDRLKPKPKRTSFSHEEGSIPNPEVVYPKPALYLSTWIRKNIERARQLDLASRPVLEETERMRALLCAQFGLLGVRWASKWGLSNYHGCLKRFHATAEERRGEPWVEGLKGHTLVFGSETGVTASGEIVLSGEDVPQDWLALLNSVRRYDRVLRQMPELELTLSTMLNGIAISRRCQDSPIMADRNSRQLLRLIHGLQSDPHGLLTGDLGHLLLAVESASGPLTVTPSGQILIPCSCPGIVARNFIEQTKLGAAKAMRDYLRNKTEEEMIISECQHVLNLHSLTKDDQISHAQMCQSCLRLIDDVSQVGVALTGLRIRVSRFYSVMNSGEMVIPWDWKGHVD